MFGAHEPDKSTSEKSIYWSINIIPHFLSFNQSFKKIIFDRNEYFFNYIIFIQYLSTNQINIKNGTNFSLTFRVKELKLKELPRKLKKKQIHFSKKDLETSELEIIFSQEGILPDLLNGQNILLSKDKKESF